MKRNNALVPALALAAVTSVSAFAASSARAADQQGQLTCSFSYSDQDYHIYSQQLASLRLTKTFDVVTDTRYPDLATVGVLEDDNLKVTATFTQNLSFATPGPTDEVTTRKRLSIEILRKGTGEKLSIPYGVYGDGDLAEAFSITLEGGFTANVPGIENGRNEVQFVPYRGTVSCETHKKMPDLGSISLPPN